VINGPDQTAFPPLQGAQMPTTRIKGTTTEAAFCHSIKPHNIMSDVEPSTQRTIPDGIYTLKQGTRYLTANAPGLPVTLNPIGIVPPQPNQKVNGVQSLHTQAKILSSFP
jgi:hypothetical protein